MASEVPEDSKKPAALFASNDDDDDNSDVELTGVDMEGDDEVMATAEDQEVDAVMAEADDGAEVLAAQEEDEINEARKERMELAAAEAKGAKAAPANAQDRIQYLLAQSEVFAHFLAGSVAAAGAKKGKGSRGKSGRLTEAEEDAQLLKTAMSKRRVVRLDTQPSILASHCKMHPYQCKFQSFVFAFLHVVDHRLLTRGSDFSVEGLNWMIKLHDHGINGILADEM